MSFKLVTVVYPAAPSRKPIRHSPIVPPVTVTMSAAVHSTQHERNVNPDSGIVTEIWVKFVTVASVIAASGAKG
jgi:hypothetical protein